jgi:Flp pilus assembly protein TadG
VTNFAKLRRGVSDETGAAAVEFALVLPAFLALILGVVFTTQMIFAEASLHDATEAAARCASVQTTVCTSNATTQTYAQGKYMGPAYPAPSFVSVTATCGHSVTGSITYSLNLGMTRFSVPLSAAACFP